MIVFLDRDGTLIRDTVVDGIPTARNNPNKVEFLEGVVEGCVLLKDAGYKLAMITNQPDISRQKVDETEVVATNTFIAGALGLDIHLFCPHDDQDWCNCRKPKPGMVYAAAIALSIKIDENSHYIGDRWRDIEAANAAGVNSFTLERADVDDPTTEKTTYIKTFGEAVDSIILTLKR